MDPVTILQTAHSVLVLTQNVVAFVISFKKGADGYDKKLNDLIAELESLQSVVQNVEACLETPNLIASIGGSSDAGNAILTGLDKCLQNCSSSIDDFTDLFADFAGEEERLGFLQRGARAKKMEWRLDQFVEVRQKLQTHQNAIQVSLIAINVRVTLKGNDQDAGEFQKLHRGMLELSANVRNLAKTKKSLEATLEQHQTLNEDATRVFQELDAVEETSKQVEKAAKKELTKRQLKYGHKVQQSALPPRIAKIGEQSEEPESPLPRGESDGPATVAYDVRSKVDNESPVSKNGLSRMSSLSAPHAIRASASTSALVDIQELANERPSAEITSEAFEKSIQGIIGERHKDKKRPFTDEDFDKIENLLRRVGQPVWAQRPRTYLILYLIEQVDLMSDFVLHGMKDINLPYSQERLPQFVRGHSVRHEFIQQQNLVLSPKSADLIKGGRHRHIGGPQGAEAHFVIVDQLGKGGQGVVDVVRHKMSWQEYARKRIHRSKTFAKDKKGLETFENEVNNLKRLDHTHLVRFVGSYTDTNYVGIIMDPVADCDLRKYFETTIESAFHPDYLMHLRHFMGCLCAAVQYLHKEKCRHKDLKPANILVKNHTVLITDFGIALDSSELARDTTSGPSVAYTAAYAAPEVVSPYGRRSFPADIYSLGCVFLDIVTILKRQSSEARETFYSQEGNGEKLNSQNPQALMSWIAMLETIDGEPNIPLPWISRMTAKDPNDRPEAAALLAEIQNASHGPNGYCAECCCENFSSETEDDAWQGSESEGDEQNTSHSYTIGSPRSPNSTNQSAGEGRKNNTEQTTVTLVAAESAQNSPLSTKLQKPDSARASKELPLISFTEINDRSIEDPDEALPSPNTSKKVKYEDIEDTDEALPSPDTSKKIKAEDIGDAGKPLSSPKSSKKVNEDDMEDVDKALSSPKPSKKTKGESIEDSEERLPSPKPNQEIKVSLLETPKSRSDELSTSIAKTEFRTDDSISELLQLSMKMLETHLSEQKEAHGSSWFSSRFNDSDVLSRDEKDYTLLHAAAKFADAELALDVVKATVITGADVNAINFANNTALHYAVSLVDRPEVVKFLIDSGADLEMSNLRRQTPLHVAARQGSPGTMKMLIEALDAGSAIDAQDDRGYTALHVAVMNGSTTKASMLAQAGANPNLKSCRGLDCLSVCPSELRTDFEFVLSDSKIPMEVDDTADAPSEEADDTCACQVCMISNLVNPLKDSNGEPILDCPCSFHFEVLAKEMLCDVVCLLAELGGDCKCSQCTEALAKYEAITKRDSERAAERVASCKCAECQAQRREEKTKEYEEIIDEALAVSCDCSKCEEESRESAWAMLLNAGFGERWSFRNNAWGAWKWALNDCDRYGDRPMTSLVALLLDVGNSSTIEDTNSSGMTMLHRAASCGYLRLAKFLIDKGANIERRSGSASSFTPLKWAVWQCQPAMVTFLLREGADVNQTDGVRQTVFHDIVAGWSTRKEMLPLLLTPDARLDSLDANGYSPLSLAIKREDMEATRTLIEAGADVNAPSNKIGPPLAAALTANEPQMVRFMLDSKARMEPGDSAIVHAASAGSGAALAEVLSYRKRKEIAEPDSDDIFDTDSTFSVCKRDFNGATALHLLAKARAPEIQKCISALVEECKKAGVLDRRDYHGNTPLHAAAKTGSALMVRALMSAGAYKDALNDDYKYAVEVANANRFKEIVEILGGEYVEKKKRWWRR